MQVDASKCHIFHKSIAVNSVRLWGFGRAGRQQVQACIKALRVMMPGFGCLLRKRWETYRNRRWVVFQMTENADQIR
jgi:hypothetical protein